MKKQLIFDGEVYDLVLVRNKPVAEWKPRKGELCEFCDWKNFEKPNLITIAYYAGVEFSRYKDSTGKTYTYCRPIQDPNIIQMIPWDGGECPLPPGTKALIKDRAGDFVSVMAVNMRWTHIDVGGDIMFYAVLK